jgi:hypothetical protein
MEPPPGDLLLPINKELEALETALRAELTKLPPRLTLRTLCRGDSSSGLVGLCAVLVLVAAAVDARALEFAGAVVLIVICAVVNLIHGVRERQLFLRERFDRLGRVLRSVRRGASTPILSVCENAPLNPNAFSIAPVLRGGRWHAMPTNLLVEGDVIALAHGSVAPCKLLEVGGVGSECGDGSESGAEQAGTAGRAAGLVASEGGASSAGEVGGDRGGKLRHTYKRGDRIRRREMPQTPHMSLLLSDPELAFATCGSIRRFRLLETPVASRLKSRLMVATTPDGQLKEVPRRAARDVPSLVKQDKVRETTKIVSVVLTIAAFVVGLVRASSLKVQYAICEFTVCPAGAGAEGSAGGGNATAIGTDSRSLVAWGDLILMRPVCVLLCLVPISLPIRMFLLDSYSTARLLSVMEEDVRLHSERARGGEGGGESGGGGGGGGNSSSGVGDGGGSDEEDEEGETRGTRFRDVLKFDKEDRVAVAAELRWQRRTSPSRCGCVYCLEGVGDDSAVSARSSALRACFGFVHVTSWCDVKRDRIGTITPHSLL